MCVIGASLSTVFKISTSNRVVAARTAMIGQLARLQAQGHGCGIMVIEIDSIPKNTRMMSTSRQVSELAVQTGFLAVALV